MKSHPAADLFPMMSESDILALAVNIRENGLLQPILTISEDGTSLILDGRNRYQACVLAGVAPTFLPFGGPDPFALVVSANLHRRHMTESQRGMVASQLATLKNGMNKAASAEAASVSASQAEAAKLLNVSRSTVQRARKVEERGIPELVAAVVSGSMPVRTAERISEMKPEAQKLALSTPSVSRPVKSDKKSHPNRNDAGHEAVKRGYAEGLTVSEIAAKTGLKKNFVAHALTPIRKPTNVLAGAIQDAEVFAESWAMRVSNFDSRWVEAAKEDRESLIRALTACRTAAMKIINRLKKEANEGKDDEVRADQTE